MDSISWLAGLLEGEGSFCAAPPSKRNAIQISLEITDEDIIRRVAAMLETSVCKPARRSAVWKQSFRASIRGKKAAEWMRLLRPMMGRRRQTQIDRALASFTPDPTHFTVTPRAWPSDAKLLAMAKDMSQRKIALVLGVSHQAVHARIKKLRKRRY